MMNLHTLWLAVLLGPQMPPAMPEPGPAALTDQARLRELLYSRQEPQEQSQAALFLVQSRVPEAVEIVREGLRRFDRPDVFQALSAAIRLRRDARYCESLMPALSVENPAIRQAATDTLARLDTVGVVRRLSALAEDNQAPLTARQSAVATLGRSMHKPAVMALLSLLSSDAPAVRQAAAAALEELTGQSCGTDVAKWQTWWEVHKQLSDEEWLAERTAYFADRGRRLRNELSQAENHIVQLQQTLYGKVPAADRPSHLRTLLQNDYPAVRIQAIIWAVELLPEADQEQHRVVTEMLLQASADGVEAVQRRAVLALERVPDERAFDRLLTLMESHQVSVRAAAARSLGRHRKTRESTDAALHRRAVHALERALNDSALPVVAEAAESLGALGEPEAAPLLAGLLRHPSNAVRQAVARGLESVARPDILADLQGGLDDPLPSVRFCLVGAMGKAGATATAAATQKADIVKRLEAVVLRDGDPGVRSRAATVIGELGTPDHLAFLWQRVTTTEDNRVQLKAWAAMIDILARSRDWPLVRQWDLVLTEKSETTRRIELLTEVRARWLRLEQKPQVDEVTGALVQALLAQRKWPVALPLTRDLARRAKSDDDLKQRLHWLLIAGNQAVADDKPHDALQMLKDIPEEWLQRSRDLAAEFEALRRRATDAMGKG